MVNKVKQNLSLYQNSNVAYSVFFSNNLFDDPNILSKLSALCKNKPILIVMDKNVSKIYSQQIEKYFKSINQEVNFINFIEISLKFLHH